MEAARHIQSTQNGKLVILLHYIKKKSVATAFVFYCDATNIYCIKLSQVSSKQYRLCMQQGIPLQLFYFVEVTPKERKRNYHVWTKECKSAFEIEFAKYLEKQHGYPGKDVLL